MHLSDNMRRHGRNAERGRGGERRGDGQCPITLIPFSKNRIHLLAPFAAKEMMNIAASRLRFCGRKRCSAGAPGGWVGQLLAYIFFTGNDVGNRKI